MAAPTEPPLSRRERQIMDIIYARGQATADQVLSDMPDPPSNTAVRTFLRILEKKGHLKHHREGRRFIYTPNRPRKLAGQSALQRVLSTFFDGSLEHAVAAHLADHGSDMKPDELERLRKLIEQARREES